MSQIISIAAGTLAMLLAALPVAYIYTKLLTRDPYPSHSKVYAACLIYTWACLCLALSAGLYPALAFFDSLTSINSWGAWAGLATFLGLILGSILIQTIDQSWSLQSENQKLLENIRIRKDVAKFLAASDSTRESEYARVEAKVATICEEEFRSKADDDFLLFAEEIREVYRPNRKRKKTGPSRTDL